MSGHKPIYEIRQTKGISRLRIHSTSVASLELGGHFAGKHPSVRFAERGRPTGLPPVASPEPVGISAASQTGPPLAWIYTEPESANSAPR
jgi:hypothetical protein